VPRRPDAAVGAPRTPVGAGRAALEYRRPCMDVPGLGHDGDAGAGRGGAALLAIAASASATQIAETLLGSGAGWRVARPVDGAVDRLELKRAVDELGAAAPAIALIVLAAPLAMIAGAPSVILAAEAERYPDDASLALSWLGERLRAVTAPTVIVLAAPTWPEASVVTASVAALEASDPLVVVAAPGDDVVASLAAALAGAALDPTTGTITLASLGRYLGAALGECRVRPTARVASILTPPPVAPELELLRSRRSGASVSASVGVTGVGTVLPGRFRLDEELARGSFGAVYRARQLAVDRDVAIKLLHDDLDPTSADGRLFLHEVRAVGRLDHPNVVRIYQADVSHDGRLFYAMELLRGSTLAALCADGPLPAPRAVALTGQLLAGLAAAHEAGLVHADVKPANAMVVEARGGERLVLLDFGLARLRQAEPAASAGGTPAFMAPEQLHDGRVDARSDVFAVGLVLVTLLTGWRRTSARDLVPPLDGIADPHLRAVLARALALEPRERYPSAAEFAAALAREAAAPPPPRPPFVRLASLTEADAERLCGRDRERALLLDHVLFRSAVVVTAPSGVGKTSLLRAGLVPRLAQLGVLGLYASGRATPLATLVEALAPGAPDLATALDRRAGAGRVVVVLDQVEALLLGDHPELTAILALVREPAPEVAVVLSVREDFLARLLDRAELVGAPAPVVRIGPLTREAAELALVTPLAERRIEVEPALIAAVVSDLVAAAGAMGPELGWGDAPAVFPPHLQLVGAALYDALPDDEPRLTLAHYQALGGFTAVVGEHLERVLETELTPAQGAIARELFIALVTTASSRATRDEAELIALAGGDGAAVVAVLEVLRAQGLVAPVRGAEPRWELAHDSLVPRVLGWLDRQDLARRRAMEQVRYHLRRARGGGASLLSRAELRELELHPGALAELDAEHTRRGGEAQRPSELVARSRRVARRRAVAVAALAVTVAAGVGLAAYDRWTIAAAADRERSIAERDLGRFTLALAPFDWDPPLAVVDAPGGRARPVEAGALPALRLAIHDPDPADPDAPGPVRPTARATIRPVSGQPGRFTVEASGGGAFLVIDGRGRAGEAPCGPSVIPVRALPGYPRRAARPPEFTIAVPTCQATWAGMIKIPAGPFIEGGPGEPVSERMLSEAATAHERVSALPGFAIDQTEVTNAAYAMLTSMASFSGIRAPIYADSAQLERAMLPEYPVTSLPWGRARAYCAFLGKRLPTRGEWQKALRGGLSLPGGGINPYPRRNYPWGDPTRAITANVVFEVAVSPMPVGSVAGDLSPYGLVDLAGNVQEWTNDHDERGLAIASGGEWSETRAEGLADMLAISHSRPEGLVTYYLGLRCAL
jgi:formylglycine-generating enzyme required for sulfatase activity